MAGFFKSFFASLVALIVFVGFLVILFFIFVGVVFSPSRPDVGEKAVLVVDLGQEYREQEQGNALAELGSEDEYDVPGVYDLVRIIRHAKRDSAIRGIYLKCNNDQNGFATNEEIRLAVADFKSAGKFVYAYGDVVSQRAYSVANVADKIYCNPKGGVDWRGYATDMLFLKDALDRLQIEPQIFYAGKFKSATEPLRETKMTDANRVQLTELLGGLYNQFLWNLF